MASSSYSSSSSSSSSFLFGGAVASTFSSRCVSSPSTHGTSSSTSSRNEYCPSPSAPKVCFPKDHDPFGGRLCCKLWFTVTLNHSARFCTTLTSLQAQAVTADRRALNSHIPDRVVRLLSSHLPEVDSTDEELSCSSVARQRFCSGNHKNFFPHPPTCMTAIPHLRIDAFCQCMGDLVAQNGAQLHWGINLVSGAKAESSNCVAGDWRLMCASCVRSLLCDHNDAGDPPLSTYLPVLHNSRRLNRAAPMPDQQTCSSSESDVVVCEGDDSSSCRPPSSSCDEEDVTAADRKAVDSFMVVMEEMLKKRSNWKSKHDSHFCWGYEKSVPIKIEKLGRAVKTFDAKDVMKGIHLGLEEWKKLTWTGVVRRNYRQQYTMTEKLHDFGFKVLESWADGDTGRRFGKPPLQFIRLSRDIDVEDLRKSDVCCSVHLDLPYWETGIPLVNEERGALEDATTTTTVTGGNTSETVTTTTSVGASSRRSNELGQASGEAPSGSSSDPRKWLWTADQLLDHQWLKEIAEEQEADVIEEDNEETDKKSDKPDKEKKDEKEDIKEKESEKNEKGRSRRRTRRGRRRDKAERATGQRLKRQSVKKGGSKKHAKSKSMRKHKKVEKPASSQCSGESTQTPPTARAPSESRHERDYDIGQIEYQRMWPLFVSVRGEKKLLGWICEAAVDQIFSQRQLRVLLHFMRKEEKKRQRLNEKKREEEGDRAVQEGEENAMMWKTYEDVVSGWEWSSDEPNACFSVSFDQLQTPNYKRKALQRYHEYIRKNEFPLADSMNEEEEAVVFSDNEVDEYDQFEEDEEFQDLARGTGKHPSDMPNSIRMEEDEEDEVEEVMEEDEEDDEEEEQVKQQNVNAQVKHHKVPRYNPVAMMQSGFCPYIQLYQCSIGSRVPHLVHDQSYHNRYKGVPYLDFKHYERDALGPGVNHGLIYTTVGRGSVFCVHSEQAGLGAVNQIVGCHLPLASGGR
eukprot:GHVS01083344.1.p1 GENE.GHVS01083344.1~~GHVS01083344.1.p1  ORF type:complete len:965 (-),score=196.97 GHVS01083344.1:184-3078(-)